MWVWDVCDYCMPNHGSGILHVYIVIFSKMFLLVVAIVVLLRIY